MLLNRHAKGTRDILRVVTLSRIHRLFFFVFFNYCRRLMISRLLLTLMEYLGGHKVEHVEGFTLELNPISEDFVAAVTRPVHFLIKQL